MPNATYQADVIIVGGGLAGIVAAYELLTKRNNKILLIEKGTKENFGGLAKESFGGIHLINTPYQRRMGIHDSPELAYRDWEKAAYFESDDEWPKQWARFYCENSFEYIFDFIQKMKIQFLPFVNWAERGLFQANNSVPRWHVVWGTGYEIIYRILKNLENHKNYYNLTILYNHEVNDIETKNNQVVGVAGKEMNTDDEFIATSENVIISSGGICGGDLTKIRQNWYKPWGKPPQTILNGAHIYGDGLLHDKIESIGGKLTHLDKQWLYPAGINHPAKRKPHDGLSLVPPRSALWLNAMGERIGPVPLVGGTDTRFLVESILKQPGQYSWQLLNWKIAIKELGVSGCDYMTAFRKKSYYLLLKHLLFGNTDLINRLIRDCKDDIVTANSLSDLVKEMNIRSLNGFNINPKAMKVVIQEYDDQIDRGLSYFNDDQLRRLVNFRSFIGDRIRLCKYQKILDQKAFPLIAIREFILSRKSLGGIQTDLNCRVLNKAGSPIPGLYAIGEASGFGGGGIHGRGSLEGTFLGSCILTARVVGKNIISS